MHSNTLSKSEITNQLLSFLTEPIKVGDGSLNSHVNRTFKKCIDYSIDLEKSESINERLFQITSVLDYLHDELNTGHWSDIPKETRQNFAKASFVKVLLLVRLSGSICVKTLSECLKCLDMGLLLGAPLGGNPEPLSEAAKFIRVQINSMVMHNKVLDVSIADQHKRKREDDIAVSNFQKLPGKTVDEVEIPSIETFNKSYFTPQIPVKLKGCMTHWPAVTKWLDINYLLEVAGDRTVPVEIGSHYADEDWSQKLMTLKEFIKKHYLSDNGDVGYLAQHNLFDQISELKEDIRIPEYCCCSSNYDESTEPDVNAWFGPQGTVSPLHQDPKNNILTQVYGTKQVLLFSPKDTEYLYPHDEKMLSNTAQVDPVKPDHTKFPNFKKAKMYKCLLEPGEMLFIPVKWWHHVSALDKSFSVSFWWQ